MYGNTSRTRAPAHPPCHTAESSRTVLALENVLVHDGCVRVLPTAYEPLQVVGVEQYAMRAFADALETIPMVLAENCGLPGLETLAQIKARQVDEDNSYIGVDYDVNAPGGMCSTLQSPSNMTLLVCPRPLTSIVDMKARRVFETLLGKQQQFLLATQVVKMILKIGMQACVCSVFVPLSCAWQQRSE